MTEFATLLALSVAGTAIFAAVVMTSCICGFDWISDWEPDGLGYCMVSDPPTEVFGSFFLLRFFWVRC